MIPAIVLCQPSIDWMIVIKIKRTHTVSSCHNKTIGGGDPKELVGHAPPISETGGAMPHTANPFLRQYM